MARTKSALHGFLKDIDAARIARGRNTLAAWLRTHHDVLLAELDGRPIDWELYLAVFAKRGLKDADGNTPTKATASKTWHRVRAAIAAERARKQARMTTPAVAPGELAPGVRRLDPDPVTTAASALPASETSRPRMRLDIRPATPLANRTADLAVSAPALPASAPSGPVISSRGQPDGDATDPVRRLRQQMDAGKVPLPKIVR